LSCNIGTSDYLRTQQTDNGGPNDDERVHSQAKSEDEYSDYEITDYGYEIEKWLEQGLLRPISQYFKDAKGIYKEVVAITGEHVIKTRSEFTSYVANRKVEHPQLEEIEKRLRSMPSPRVI
jgi:hypothetical protein